jgi:site-specific recombinase XerD
VNTPGARKGLPAPNKGLKLPAEVYSPQEIARILRACGRGPAGARNSALIVVMWRGGLRCAEACALEPHDVDQAEGTIRVRHGKGDKARTVGMDPQAFAIIERWLAVRGKLRIPRGAPLFCTFSHGSIGYPLGGGYVRTMIKRVARHAGIEKRVHPHGLRHTHATELTREKVSVKLIQAQLGHTSLSVTQRYLDHLHPVEVIETMQARHWPLPS